MYDHHHTNYTWPSNTNSYCYFIFPSKKFFFTLFFAPNSPTIQYTQEFTLINICIKWWWWNKHERTIQQQQQQQQKRLNMKMKRNEEDSGRIVEFIIYYFYIFHLSHSFVFPMYLFVSWLRWFVIIFPFLYACRRHLLLELKLLFFFLFSYFCCWYVQFHIWMVYNSMKWDREREREKKNPRIIIIGILHNSSFSFFHFFLFCFVLFGILITFVIFDPIYL